MRRTKMHPQKRAEFACGPAYAWADMGASGRVCPYTNPYTGPAAARHRHYTAAARAPRRSDAGEALSAACGAQFRPSCHASCPPVPFLPASCFAPRIAAPCLSRRARDQAYSFRADGVSDMGARSRSFRVPARVLVPMLPAFARRLILAELQLAGQLGGGTRGTLLEAKSSYRVEGERSVNDVIPEARCC